MLSEVDVAGVYVAPIVVYGVAALPLTLALRSVLFRIGALRLLWHPALFILSLYLSILSLLVLFV